MKRPLIVFLFLCFGWKFVNSEGTSSVDCNLFKVRTEDTSESSGYKDNDTSKYTHELKGLLKNQPLYKFNTGTKFVALLYNDEFVWQHSSSHDPSKFPTELEIDPFNNTLWIKYGGMDFITFKFDNNKWNHSEELTYGDCKRVKIPDYNATSAPSTPEATPAEVKEGEEEAEKPEEEAKPEKAEDESEEKSAEESTEVDTGDGEGKTEDAEPVKPEEGAPEVEESEKHPKEAEEKTEDAAEAGEAHREEDHVSPGEGEPANPPEAGTDGDAPAGSEAVPLAEGEDASATVDTTPDVAVPESHDDSSKAPHATLDGAVPEASEGDAGTVSVDPETAPVAPEESSSPPTTGDDGSEAPDSTPAPEVQEDDASKAYGVVPEEGTDAGVDSKDGEAKAEDTVLSNLYPSDHSGSYHFGLRGTFLDEEVDGDAEEKSEESEKAAEEPEEKTEEADKAAEVHKEKEAKESDVTTPPDAKPEDGVPESEVKKEDHVASEETDGAKPADETVDKTEEGEKASEGSEEKEGDKGTDHGATPSTEDASVSEPSAEVDSSKPADADATPVPAPTGDKDASTTPDADMKGKSVPSGKMEHDGKHLKVFTLSDDESTEEEDKDGKYHLELENKVLLATFNEGVKCVKLEYGNKEVWKHDSTKHGTNHPTQVKFDTESLEVVLSFNDKSKFTYKYDGKSDAHAFALSTVPLDISERPPNLKFFKDEDGADEIGDADLSLAKEFHGTKEFVVHSFNAGVKCHVVKYGENKVWEYETDFQDNFPASVHYNKDDHELRVFVRNNWFYFYKFDADKNEHDIYREKEPAEFTSE